MKGQKECLSAKESPSCSDERFNMVLNQAIDLRGLVMEIIDITRFKFDALLGVPQPEPCSEQPKKPTDCWIDKVLYEQGLAIETCKDILERLQLV